MTVGRRYAAGICAVSALGALAGALCDSDARRGIWLGTALAVGLQGPLGWWLVRTWGTGRFLPAWGLGVLGRFGVLALAGLVVVPLLDWPLAPTLVALVAVLLALLSVEIMTLLVERSRPEVR